MYSDTTANYLLKVNSVTYSNYYKKMSNGTDYFPLLLDELNTKQMDDDSICTAGRQKWHCTVMFPFISLKTK